MPEFEEAVVGGTEGDRRACGFEEAPASGDGERRPCRHRDQFGVRAEGHRRDDLVADGESGHALADLTHRPSRLVADDVRTGGELATSAMEHVPAFDADRLHREHDPAGTALRIGDVFVAEDGGVTRFVVDGCFHRVLQNPTQA